MFQRTLGGALNHWSIGHGIGEGYAQLDDRGPGPRQLNKQFSCRLKIGIARSDERDESFLPFPLQLAERILNSAQNFTTPDSL